jgi:hypothetical protein
MAVQVIAFWTLLDLAGVIESSNGSVYHLEFMDAERVPGNWPVDERLAFIECREKLDKARKEAANWRDNHKRAMAEVERLRLEIERIKADRSADQGRPSA